MGVEFELIDNEERYRFVGLTNRSRLVVANRPHQRTASVTEGSGEPANAMPLGSPAHAAEAVIPATAMNNATKVARI
jgi:hypothetical protein